MVMKDSAHVQANPHVAFRLSPAPPLSTCLERDGVFVCVRYSSSICAIENPHKSDCTMRSE